MPMGLKNLTDGGEEVTEAPVFEAGGSSALLLLHQQKGMDHNNPVLRVCLSP